MVVRSSARRWLISPACSRNSSSNASRCSAVRGLIERVRAVRRQQRVAAQRQAAARAQRRRQRVGGIADVAQLGRDQVADAAAGELLAGVVDGHQPGGVGEALVVAQQLVPPHGDLGADRAPPLAPHRQPHPRLQLLGQVALVEPDQHARARTRRARAPRRSPGCGGGWAGRARPRPSPAASPPRRSAGRPADRARGSRRGGTAPPPAGRRRSARGAAAGPPAGRACACPLPRGASRCDGRGAVFGSVNAGSASLPANARTLTARTAPPAPACRARRACRQRRPAHRRGRSTACGTARRAISTSCSAASGASACTTATCTDAGACVLDQEPLELGTRTRARRAPCAAVPPRRRAASGSVAGPACRRPSPGRGRSGRPAAGTRACPPRTRRGAARGPPGTMSPAHSQVGPGRACAAAPPPAPACPATPTPRLEHGDPQAAGIDRAGSDLGGLGAGREAARDRQHQHPPVACERLERLLPGARRRRGGARRLPCRRAAAGRTRPASMST